jgi:hypothetical protein
VTRPNLASVFDVSPLTERSWFICAADSGEPLGHLSVTYAGFNLVESDGSVAGTFPSIEAALIKLGADLGIER